MRDPYNIHKIWNDSCYHRDNLREINIPRQDFGRWIKAIKAMKPIEPTSSFILAKELFEWNEE